MQLITHATQETNQALVKVKLQVDRFKLAKRRWRGQADDGSDFGFDLEKPLHHESCFFQTETHSYWIEQSPEKVLEVDYSDDCEGGCRLGWSIGNLHMPMQTVGLKIRVADDPAIRQLFAHLNIQFTENQQVFQPLRVSTQIGSSGHSHGEGHHHSHD